jgi:hypothetical protein
VEGDREQMKRILTALALYVFTSSPTFAQDFIDDNPLSPTDAPEMAVLATLDRIERDSRLLKMVLAEYNLEDIEASNPYLFQRIKAAQTHAQQARWYYEKMYPKMIEWDGLEEASRLLVMNFQEWYVSDIRKVVSDLGNIEVPQQAAEELTGDAPRELDQTLDITSNDPPLRRDLFNDEIANSCEENKSPDECVETFEVAAAVVAVADPDKGGAAEWTGRKAKEVSDDLVKLGGTQEQLMDVIQTSTDNVNFIEKSLPASTRIDGPKEAAAVNLVKAAMNITELKPESNVENRNDLATAINFVNALNTVTVLDVRIINQKIDPARLRVKKSDVELNEEIARSNKEFRGAMINGTLDTLLAREVISLPNVGRKTPAPSQLTNFLQDIKRQVSSGLTSYAAEKAQQAKQNDAPTTVQQVVPQVQVQQQQQQQNCNPQFQNC